MFKTRGINFETVARRPASTIVGVALILVGAGVSVFLYQAGSVCTIPSDGGCLSYRYADAPIIGLAVGLLFGIVGGVLLLRPSRPPVR